MNISTLCLAILSFGDATGYDIRKLSMEGSFSYFVDASYGAIYPALSKLADESLVTVRDEMQPGKPARKVYSITDKGRQELERSLNEPLQPDRIKSEFLLAALCAEYIDRDRLAEHIDQRSEQIHSQIDEFETIAEQDCSGERHEPTRWAVDFAHAMNEAKLAFLTTNRDRILACARPRRSREAAE